MSQVFSGDAVNNAAGVSLPFNVETAVVTSNALNPPFGNAKAIVYGFVNLTVGSTVNGVNIAIRRNPLKENLLVGSQLLNGATGAAVENYTIMAADAIPDGRSVQYALTVTETSGAGTGTATFASIAAILISG
jgi:hypothetical protein